jgi:2'-5' RNA ligase
MANLRLFIALKLPEAMQKRLSAVQQNLQPQTGSLVKWVEPKNMHLTLEFLGDTADSRVALLKEILQQTAAGCPALKLSLNGVGAFPHWRSPRVIWVGLAGDILPLEQLQKKLHQALLEQGFRLEHKAFKPHLTLGRVKRRFQSKSASPANANLDLEKMAAKQTGLLKPEVFTLKRVELMQSVLTREGPIYTALSSVALSVN